MWSDSVSLKAYFCAIATQITPQHKCEVMSAIKTEIGNKNAKGREKNREWEQWNEDRRINKDFQRI